MPAPTISIIIPTRNGGRYVCSAIESVLAQTYERAELIVSVNHSSDDTLGRLRRFHDPRLRVVIPPQALSMPKHYEWCVRQAHGEWVTIIGDDDGVMPYFFQEADKLLSRWLHRDVDVFSFRRALYFWPGCEEVYGDKVVDYSAADNERLAGGASIVLGGLVGTKIFYDLPHLYTNSLVRRSLVDDIRVRSDGIFFHERNPDVYSGVAIALAARRFVRVELPLFWTGTSPKSVGLSSQFASSYDQTCQQSQTLSPALANEFHHMSQADNVPVAEEIGLDAWKTCTSSSLFVASALLRVPFPVPLIFRWRKGMLALALASAQQEVSDTDAHYGDKMVALAEVARRNRIGPGSAALAWMAVRGYRFTSRVSRAFARLYGCAFPKPVDRFPRLQKTTRDGLTDLMDAHVLVAEAWGISPKRCTDTNPGIR